LPVAAALALALASLALPAFLVRVPTFWDYPNHLVRFWILLGHAEGTPVAGMYQPDWSLAWTNIGTDLLAVALGRMLPFDLVGPVLVALAAVILPLGAILLNRAVFGGWHAWQVAIVLLAWNFVLVSGLLSFQIALGLALLAAALHGQLMRSPRWLRGMATAVLAALIMVVHLFGLIFYLALLVALDLGSRRPALGQPMVRALLFRRMVVSVLACVVPLAVFLLLAPRLPGAHAPAEGGQILGTAISFPPLTVLSHLSIALTPLKTYALVPDLVTVAVFLALPLHALYRRRVQRHAGLLAVGLALFVLSHFMPGDAFGTGLLDKRLPVMSALMLAAAIRPQVPGGARGGAIVLAVLLGAVLARSAWIGGIWIVRQDDIRSVEAATAGIAPGSAVLLAENLTDSAVRRQAPEGRYAQGASIYRHIPTLIVMSRHAFVPTIFTAAGKQPLKVLPAWADRAVPEGSIPSVDDLDDPAAARGEFHYLKDWRGRFDYLLLVNADLPNRGIAIDRVPGISLVSDRGFARLYQIDRRP